MKPKYLIGIDEAGRGPLAGPVAVGAVCVARSVRHSVFNNLGLVRDSKFLSVKQREELFGRVRELAKAGSMVFTSALVGQRLIDRVGIVAAVRLGIVRCLRRLRIEPTVCRVLLDGTLRAPRRYKNQQTIIRGDESEPLIALASIVAKVRRDRLMIRLAKNFPNYHFETHKGYGTAAHYRVLRRHGLSPLHRRSFLKNFYF